MIYSKRKSKCLCSCHTFTPRVFCAHMDRSGSQAWPRNTPAASWKSMCSGACSLWSQWVLGSPHSARHLGARAEKALAKLEAGLGFQGLSPPELPDPLRVLTLQRQGSSLSRRQGAQPHSSWRLGTEAGSLAAHPVSPGQHKACSPGGSACSRRGLGCCQRRSVGGRAGLNPHLQRPRAPTAQLWQGDFADPVYCVAPERILYIKS